MTAPFPFGSDTIDRYPPLQEIIVKRLIIHGEAIYQALEKEVLKYFPKIKPVTKVNDKKTRQHRKKSKTHKSFRDFEPTNIHSVYNGNRWRWRRMYEWFNQFSLDHRQGASLEDILKMLD